MTAPASAPQPRCASPPVPFGLHRLPDMRSCLPARNRVTSTAICPFPRRHRTRQRPHRYSRNHGNRRVILPILPNMPEEGERRTPRCLPAGGAACSCECGASGEGLRMDFPPMSDSGPRMPLCALARLAPRPRSRWASSICGESRKAWLRCSTRRYRLPTSSSTEPYRVRRVGENSICAAMGYPVHSIAWNGCSEISPSSNIYHLPAGYSCVCIVGNAVGNRRLRHAMESVGETGRSAPGHGDPQLHREAPQVEWTSDK